ncbi:MAG: DNA polymerase I [Bacteroidetes bacterium]|nr:DNA polymerase I [Bacteroidota bacterium]
MKSQDWTDNKLFLLDAYALIFRAYYALIRTPLVNSKGMNVSAISGFTSTLIELINKEKPTHMAVVFDLGKTNREIEHEFYKANRADTPEDIKASVPWICEIIKAMNIPILQLEGYEADDIIGTIAKKKAAEGHLVYMVTPDKDYAQLVGENIFIYKPGRQGSDVEILGLEDIKKNWEVERPEQVIDILGLWGDSVDNIPGIPGVGEKTAKKLMQEYGSMENIIANADKIKGKMGENIKAHAEQGLISKKLATIQLDVPIDVTDEELHIDEPNKERLTELFAELEFRTLGKRILGDTYTANSDIARTKGVPAANGQADLFGGTVEPPKAAAADAKEDMLPIVTHGRNITNTEHKYLKVGEGLDLTLDELVARLEAQPEYCFDTETTGLDYFVLDIVGLSFSFHNGEAYYVPCPADEAGTMAIINKLKPLLEDTTKLKIGQNVKYDMHVLYKYGVEVNLPIYDTMVGHYIAEPDLKHGMDYLSETYLGYTPVSIEELIGKKGKNQGNMRDVPLDKIAEYASEDADITWQLKSVIAPMVEARELTSVLNNIEHPLIPVLAGMEREGVKVDEEFLREYSKVLQVDLTALEDQIYTLAGLKFNIDSPKQMGEVLFKHLNIPQDKKTATGQASTNEAVLSKLAGEYPIVARILDYREIAKLKSTYVDALPELINPKTGRIHTTFNQTIAATGRLSSIAPNLQNIPVRTERGRMMRKAFIARDADHVLLSADYSQIELRLVAEMSGDKGMMEAFQQKLDIHTATAAKVYGVAYDEVTKEMRYKAKSVNFGIIYGQGAFGLAENLGIPRSEAKAIIDNYFVQFPGIKEYMNNNIEFARKNGYVKTMMGRRRYLKDINSGNFTVRGFAERNAINAPVQGSAADMIKIAMIGIYDEFKKRNLKSRMTLQVHDELVFDAHKDELEEIKPIISDKMVNAIKTNVPIEIGTGVGSNWLDAH